MDELLKKVLQTIGLIVFFMLLVYFLIATGPEKPGLLTLVYYNFMNSVFAAIWWFIQMVVLVVGIASVAFIIFQVWRAKRDAEAAKELKLRKEIIREKEKRIKQEEERIQQEEMQKRAQLEQMKKEQLLLEKDRYLRNRSAEEANNDALKHFL